MWKKSFWLVLHVIRRNALIDKKSFFVQPIKNKQEAYEILLFVYDLGVLGHFAPWGIFELGNIRKFWLKEPEDKNCEKFTKILKSSCIIFCVKMPKYFQYIYIYIFLTKRIEAFWSRDVSSIWGIRTFWTISSLYVLNCFNIF